MCYKTLVLYRRGKIPLMARCIPKVLKIRNSFVSFKANGKAPTRAYHSASLFRHELWIFGGVFPQPDPKPDGSSNDIYVFSPIQENWYMPIVMGEKPAPRSGFVPLVLNFVIKLDNYVVYALEREKALGYRPLYLLYTCNVKKLQCRNHFIFHI